MRYQHLDQELFINNRKRLVESLKPGSIAILFSNYQMPRNGDQYFPYRQNSDFFFLTGIEQEKSILILTNLSITGLQNEVLITLRSNKLLETWEGHKLSEEEASAISGIKSVKYTGDFDTLLHSVLPFCENVYLNIPENPKFNPEVKSRDEIFALQFRGRYPQFSPERLAPILQQLRLIKDPKEVDLIRSACTVTKNAFHTVLGSIKPGMKEFEIEALITYEFIRHGSSGNAYQPIIAGGKNACALHYTSNDSVCNANELVLMDFGAEYANYSADLSRTIPVSGSFSKRQRQLYDATLRVFNFAKSIIKPGTTINKFHTEVCKKWEEEHISLGLYSQKDVKNHRGENPLWFNFYMHGTSHFLGLDVHDCGTKDTILEPGMVLTCEPALYLPEESIGIRLENNLLITPDGNIDLMNDIPIEADEIESLMKHL